MTEMTPEREKELRFQSTGGPDAIVMASALKEVFGALDKEYRAHIETRAISAQALDAERKAHAETIDKRLDLSIKYNEVAVKYNEEKQRAEKAEAECERLKGKRAVSWWDERVEENEKLKARVEELESDLPNVY